MSQPQQPWNPRESAERRWSDSASKALAQRIEQLRAQKNLTREGRAARIAHAVTAANAEMAALREAEQARLSARRGYLTKQVFGYHNPDPAQVISIRDAQDRVAKVEKAEDMAALMNRADRNGDVVLLRAAAQECAARSGSPLADPGYAPLFYTWVAQQHYGPEIVQELADIDQELNDPTARLIRERAFSTGPLPDELQGQSGTQIRELAARADEIPELPPTRAEQVGARMASWVKGHAEVE